MQLCSSVAVQMHGFMFCLQFPSFSCFPISLFTGPHLILKILLLPPSPGPLPVQSFCPRHTLLSSLSNDCFKKFFESVAPTKFLTSLSFPVVDVLISLNLSFLCVCVHVCVCERERETEGGEGGRKEGRKEGRMKSMTHSPLLIKS